MAVLTRPDPPPAPSAKVGTIHVGEWRVDPALNEIRREREIVRLEPKAIELLAYLARRPGEVVGREELLAAVWPGMIVADDALSQAITKLRKALGDEARSPKYIETISKRGYRLIAPVHDSDETAATAPARKAVRKTHILAALGIGATAVIAVVIWFTSGRAITQPGAPKAADVSTIAAAPPLIAVLPLANQGGDASRDYFSDGVTEDIINALGRFSGLRVMSRQAVEPYKLRPMMPQGVRSELGVRYVLRGSVRDSPEKFRVVVELSDAESGVLLWSDHYEGERRQIFEIQDRIVKDLVGRLAVKVTHLESERALAKAPESLEAYELALRARGLLRRVDRAANREARAMLAKALAVSPNYAEAHFLMARAEYVRAFYGWMEDPESGVRRAEQHARLALSVPDTGAHAKAHGLLAYIHSGQGDHERALAEADRAISLNPSDAEAHQGRAYTLVWLGRLEEALAASEISRRFDPFIDSDAGPLACYLLGRYREARSLSEASLTLFPGVAHKHALHAAILAQLGERDEAVKAAAEARRLDPFFKLENYGTRAVNPAHTAKLQEGLRKAGF